jgi:amino acid adenylation domain-containing protein
MRLVGVATIHAFELSAEIVESLSSPRFDCQTELAWGGLLEWSIAVRRATSNENAESDAAYPIRLGRVTWHAAEPTAGESLYCRTQPGGPLLVTTGPRSAGRLLLSAASAEAEPVARLPSVAFSIGELGQRVGEGQFYAELTACGFEIETNARVVEYACFRQDAALAALAAPSNLEAGFILGPSSLDAALQVAFAYAQRAIGEASKPSRSRPLPAIEDLVVVASGVPRTVIVRARPLTTRTQLDVSLLDVHGMELAKLEGVTFETRAAEATQRTRNLTCVFHEIVRACLPAVDFEPSTSLPGLGASSIDLVRIGSLASEWLGWMPPLADFLRAPTVAGLVQLYLTRDARPGGRGTLDILSATERQLWFLEQATHAAGAYNEGVAWRIRGALSIDALERALVHVQQCHPALRSYFPAPDGVPERNLDWRQCELELIETPADIRSQPELLDDYVADQICRPFDLEHAPPFRCALLFHGAGDSTIVLSAHHLICDAWSFAHVVVPELRAAYRSLLESPELQLPVASVESELARHELDPAERKRSEEHFRRTLRELPHVLDFPFDHPRPAVQLHRGACVHRPLTAARWSAVKALARELGQSPFVVCLAAHEILLQRYTRSDAFCVGVPVSLRRDSEDARKVGCFVNLSVVRARVDSAHTFDAHCARVREDLIDTLEFDRLALGEIVRAVAPVRSLSHTPLVQAVFGYRELAGATLDLPGVIATPLFVHNRRAKFDLTLSIDDCGNEAELGLEYASDLLERPSAESLLDHFEALLDELAHNPRARIGSLQLASRPEQKQIASYEHGPVRAVPPSELGLATLARSPDDVIVLRTSSREWSAAALRQLTSRIATALQCADVRPGELVVVCAPRSAEWVAAVLAILEAGAAYVPLDPRQPDARIAHGIDRSGARVVITLDAAFVPAPDSTLRTLELRGLASSTPAQTRAIPPADPHHPVYAILTSGSTGAPRLAAVAHAGFSNLLSFYSQLLSLTAADRVLLATSVGFDLTQKNVFAALLAGAQLVIDDSDSFDPERLAELIEQRGITVINCTPTLAYALVASAAALDFRKLRSVRVLVLGGEPIDEKQLRAWTAHPSCSARILNSYGPTECSDVVATSEVQAGVPCGTILGRPIPNARCRVVDCSGAVAGIGVPGELCLAGTPLGLGYFGDPAATATKFVREHGTRFYRTGDLVRWNHAGELQFLGRLDAQVKIRGYRIELAEIEAALELRPEVSDAVVISRPDPRGQPMLVGYVVLTASGEGADRALERSLRRDLARNLPSYMIPRAIVTIDRLPRTASGKLDRNALLGRAWNPDPPSLPDREPSDPILSRVRAAFCDVLGVAGIASDADFFEHGGHSLAAVALVAQLEDELGLRLRPAAVFERPVLRDFASHLAELLDQGPDSDGHPISAPRTTLNAI